jgi:hypothetical protein|tara:strand:+ start:1479 stop:1679 length:201 start_codon:yes stop_codon:yes gene_type:complete
MLPQFKKDFLEKIKEDEMTQILEIWNNVERCGLQIEVIYTALKEMKASPSSSPLLCLQIAAHDWDC